MLLQAVGSDGASQQCLAQSLFREPHQSHWLILTWAIRGDSRGDWPATTRQFEPSWIQRRNIPLSKEHFPLTDNPGYYRQCQFRELCGRED